MAKRPDFTQKLLDDLRLRKERMGVASAGQRSAQSPSTGNSYGNSRWAFRGSGEATNSRSSNKNIRSTEATKIWLSTRHHKASSFKGASQDIVPVGRTRSKEQSVDISMALALALSNIGKLQNVGLFSNVKAGKKLIVHSGSLNFTEMDVNMLMTSDQFPFLSPLQIGEISKGVQQLNMILRACSNGVSRDSIDIGRELLKGAIEFKESLRMLASLQDASDYMADSKGKQIKLLKGKEDESSSEEVNNRKLTKHRFSFDRASKHSRQHRDGSNSGLIDQKQMVLSYPEILKNPKSNSDKNSSNASLQFSYHRHSLSSVPDSRNDAQFLGYTKEICHSQELRSSSKDGNRSTSTNTKHYGSKGGSVCEKVRIPNVVAKLMGLEKLPLAMPEEKKTEVQNVPNSKQLKGSFKIETNVKSSEKEANQMTFSTPKVKRQNMVTEGRGIMETKAVNNHELVHSEVKKHMKELTNPEHNSAASAEKGQFSISKDMDMASTDCCKELMEAAEAGERVAKMEAAEAGERVSTMQQIYKEKVEQGATRKKAPENGTQNITRSLYGNSDDTLSKHEKAQRNKDVVSMHQRNAQVNPTEPQRQSEINRLKTKHTVHKYAEKIEYTKRNKPQSIIGMKREVRLKNAGISLSNMKTKKVPSSTSTTATTRSLINFSDKAQPKEYAKGNHNEQKKLQNRDVAYLEVDRRSENEISKEKKPLEAVVKTEKQNVTPLIPAPTIRKPIPNPSAQKVEATKLMTGRNENRRISLEENRRIKTTEAKVQNLKQKTSFLHELEHRWKKRTGKADALVCSHAMKSEHNSQQTTAPNDLMCSSDKSEIPRQTNQIVAAETNVEAQKKASNPTPSCDTTTVDSVVLQPPEISIKEDLQQQPLLEENKREGPADRRQLSDCNSLGQQNTAMTEVLTKDEDTLKQILMNSQHFLNTAQALFKIKISINVLKASENICQYEGNKLSVDTGYEIMRRKGKREEALFTKKISFAPVKARCLDDLVRELKNDLRSLEIPSMTEGANIDIAECLQKMIERDIQNRNPDVNSMWNICRISTTFANMEKEEIIKDVEKHVLNGLINDLARDLMSVNISI